MTHEVRILNLLLDRYERSGHCLPGKESNRRIMLNFAGGEYKEYRENDPCIADINNDIESLAAERLITTYWRKGYESWLYGRISLNLDELDRAYAKAERKPITAMVDNLRNAIHQAMAKIQTRWKLKFLEDEAAR